jgi:hypothetical protein
VRGDLLRLALVLPHEHGVAGAVEDVFDSRILVAVRDEEARRLAAHVLVPLDRHAEPLGTVGPVALTHDGQPPVFGEREATLQRLDAFVHLAEDRLVGCLPPLLLVDARPTLVAVDRRRKRRASHPATRRR